MATLWKDSLLIGNTQIDNEHKKLVQAIDALMDACMQGRGKDKVTETLNFVEQYTKIHFSHEEELQKQSEYPDRVRHKQLHDEYIKTIASLKNELVQTGGGIVFTGKLNSVLVDWLVKHIGTEDTKVGKHIAG